MTVSAIILTKNEELHLFRCLTSLEGVVDELLIVDCGSTDSTINIANQFGAKVVSNPWLNYSAQFKHGLGLLSPECKWVLRIDADEFLTEPLKRSIKGFLSSVPSDVKGAFLPRRMAFLGREIHYGGIFPAYMLRLFRFGEGEIENRWMDEHIKVVGKTVVLEGELIDDNLNSLSWWTAKHNSYASREAVDMLNLEFKFMLHDSVASPNDGTQAGLKRWLKEHVYSRMPTGSRAFLYFFYRYIVRFGFLDGKEGAMFHFLQGFWYRYLVDCKVYEVKKFMKAYNKDIKVAIETVLGINV